MYNIYEKSTAKFYILIYARKMCGFFSNRTFYWDREVEEYGLHIIRIKGVQPSALVDEVLRKSRCFGRIGVQKTMVLIQP